MVNNTGKPKIGVIGLKGFPAYGGSARAGEILIEILKNKYDFTIYNVDGYTDRKTGLYNGYKQIVFKRFPIRQLNTFIYYLKSMYSCLFKEKYDLLHIYHIDASFIIPILKLKYKIIAGVRAQPQKYSKWSWTVRQYFKLMEFIFLKMPAHIITSNSLPIIEDYKQKTKKEIVYIPNGIDLKTIKTAYPDIPFTDYILFTAGRIMESKGCHIFLEALKELNYSGKIIVIGNLTHSPKYAEKIKNIAEGMDVEFLGLIKEKDLLMAYIKNSKLAVYPSSAEGMSNMLLELASMKTPVICSDIPENTIVFTKTESLHFRTDDSSDLASKIKWALDHSEEMEQKAEKAYAKLKEIYNWDFLSLEYDKLFEQIIQKEDS